jgi:hypothetical protein
VQHAFSPEVHIVTAMPTVQMNGVLRGRGAKRDPPIASLHGKGVKRATSQRSSLSVPQFCHSDESMLMSYRPREVSRMSSRTREMRARERPRTAYIPATQPLHLPPYQPRLSARGNPLRMPQSDVRTARPEMTEVPAIRRWSTPPLGSVPDDYFTYLDIATVRAATNYALRATIYEAPLPPRPTVKRDLRRRPAYKCLQ